MSTGKIKSITINEKDSISTVIRNPKVVQDTVSIEKVDHKGEVSTNSTVNSNEADTSKGVEASEKKRIDIKPWQKITLSVFLSIVLLSGLAVSMYFYIFNRPISPSQIITIKEEYLEMSIIPLNWSEKVKGMGDNLPSPKRPRTEQSPLNGQLFTKDEIDSLKKNRPVAVMINNHTQARPLSGLNSSDIVYESVAESGITRYLAIFWSEGATKVGPVRSARQYHLEWLSPYDPLYIHDGCASSSDPRVNACGNIYTYGIKDLRTLGHWRTTDRVAPHNEYNSIVSAWEYGKKNGWDSFPDIKSLKFKRDLPEKDRGQKSKVSVRHRTDIPNGGMYDSEWTYESSTNSYLHRIGGQADIDQENGRQLSAKVVVIMEVPMQSAGDAFARVIFTTTGEGRAVILQDGKIVTGKWKKPSRIERERFYDSSGNEMELNRGRLWIMAVPKDQGKFDIIEQ